MAAGALAEVVPVMMLSLVRAVPAVLYVRLIGRRRAGVAGLMRATTLTFVIVATQIGMASGQISPATGASVLAAGLAPAALFPAAALKLLSPASSPAPTAKPRRHRPITSPFPAAVETACRHLPWSGFEDSPHMPTAAKGGLSRTGRPGLG